MAGPESTLLAAMSNAVLETEQGFAATAARSTNPFDEANLASHEAATLASSPSPVAAPTVSSNPLADAMQTAVLETQTLDLCVDEHMLQVEVAGASGGEENISAVDQATGGVAGVVSGSLAELIEDDTSEESSDSSDESAVVEINPVAVSMGLAGPVKAAPLCSPRVASDVAVDVFGGVVPQGTSPELGNGKSKLPSGPAFADQREYERDLARSEVNMYKDVTLGGGTRPDDEDEFDFGGGDQPGESTNRRSLRPSFAEEETERRKKAREDEAKEVRRLQLEEEQIRQGIAAEVEESATQLSDASSSASLGVDGVRGLVFASLDPSVGLDGMSPEEQQTLARSHSLQMQAHYRSANEPTPSEKQVCSEAGDKEAADSAPVPTPSFLCRRDSLHSVVEEGDEEEEEGDEEEEEEEDHAAKPRTPDRAAGASVAAVAAAVLSLASAQQMPHPRAGGAGAAGETVISEPSSESLDKNQGLIDEWAAVDNLRREEEQARETTAAGPGAQRSTAKGNVKFAEATGYFQERDAAGHYREIMASEQFVPTTSSGSAMGGLLNRFRRRGSSSGVAGKSSSDERSAQEKDRDLVFCIALTKFDYQEAIHQRLLQTVYKRLHGVSRDCPDTGEHWTTIGFQGSHPETDIRGTGMLGVLTMVYLVDFHLDFAFEIHRLSVSQVQEFPLMVTSMVFTGVALQALRQGKLRKLCKREGSSLLGFHRFFVALLFCFYKLYRDENGTIVSFTTIKDKAVAECLRSVDKAVAAFQTYVDRPRNEDAQATNFSEIEGL